MLHGSGARLCMVAEPVSARFPDSNLASVMLRVVGVFSAQLNEKRGNLKSMHNDTRPHRRNGDLTGKSGMSCRRFMPSRLMCETVLQFAYVS